MRVWLLAGLALAAVACSGATAVSSDLAGAIYRAEPGAVLELQPGRYQGPIIIEKPLTLIGADGVVVSAPDAMPAVTIKDTTGVVIRALAIEGGSSGVDVRRSEDVELDGVRVTQALWHGIHVQDSEVMITDCHVASLRASMPQGVEIVNSDSRPPSVVSGCVIEGPVLEGLVAHVSHVTFRDNTVTGSTARGVVITEMSDGVMKGNSVSHSAGSAYFCGDMSNCSIVGNSANDMMTGDGRVSQRGHGVVVHGYSYAFVGGLSVADIEGQDILPMIGGYLLSEPPPYP
ncbi:MAG: right-handed parallel beta-helix repeat-containing protein [Acidimicrobiia bacterium]